jgi:hypothetical protein
MEIGCGDVSWDYPAHYREKQRYVVATGMKLQVMERKEKCLNTF